MTAAEAVLSGKRAAGLAEGRIIAAIGLYFLLQLVTRLALGHNAELDESEMLVLTQAWRWGYGSQPPLYVWLQQAVFAGVGASVLGLALLKNGLLFATVVLGYFTALEVLDRRREALIATVSLLFIQQVSYESQRDLTHTVLVTLAMIATLWSAVRLPRRNRPIDYLTFGACIAMGLLAKYNFLFFLGGLLLAMASVKTYREALLTTKSLLVLIVAAVLVLPHQVWMLSHPAELFTQYAGMQVHNPGSSWAALARSAGTLGVALVGIMAVPLAVHLSVFRGPLLPYLGGTAAGPDGVRLAGRTVVAGLAICLLLIPFNQPMYEARWLQPVVLPWTLCLAARAGAHYSLPRGRLFFRLAVLAGVLVWAALVLRPLVRADHGKPCPLNLPFDRLASVLRQTGSDSGVIVGSNRLIAGNLRIRLPGMTAAAPELTVLVPTRGRPMTLVWDASKAPDPPPVLLAFAGSLRGAPLEQAQPQYLEAPLHYSNQQRLRWGFIQVPPPIRHESLPR